MGKFSLEDRNNLAKAIFAITGGDKVKAKWFAEVAVRVPKEFEKKSAEEDKNILLDLLSEIIARKAIK